MASLDKSLENRKQALMAKMTEEGWRVPAILNEPCLSLPNPSLGHPATFNSHFEPVMIEASPAAQDFTRPGQVPFVFDTPSS